MIRSLQVAQLVFKVKEESLLVLQGKALSRPAMMMYLWVSCYQCGCSVVLQKVIGGSLEHWNIVRKVFLAVH